MTIVDNTKFKKTIKTFKTKIKTKKVQRSFNLAQTLENTYYDIQCSY